MSEQPKPALSAEEWAERRFTWESERRGPGQTFDTGTAEVGPGQSGEIITAHHGTYEPGSFGGDGRLALAALCLEGYLTWEMVDDLRDAADDIEDWAAASYVGDGDDSETRGLVWLAERLLAYADKLARLLPPREPGE